MIVWSLYNAFGDTLSFQQQKESAQRKCRHCVELIWGVANLQGERMENHVRTRHRRGKKHAPAKRHLGDI